MASPPRYNTGVRYNSGARYAPSITIPPIPAPKPRTTRHRPMNDETSNRLNMIGACLTLADKPESRAVWDGQPPLAFGEGYTALAADYATALETSMEVGSDITGTTDAKATAERTLEDLAYRMARALVGYYRKVGDSANLAKVNVTRSAIVRLRHQDLTTRTTEIRDLAQDVVAEPEAVNYAITAPRITALTAAIAAFEALRNAPRSATAARVGMRDELITQVAGLVENVRDLDDLVLQFADSPESRTFAMSWKTARIVVDAGHGPGEEEPPTPPTPPTP
jgi:hypothetical protein